MSEGNETSMPGASSKAGVTVMVFTLNEEIHLPACLKSLSWCDDIVVIDSYSTDRTEQIAREHGARFFQNKFTGFGDQRNWALANASQRHDWILILDADETVRPDLAEEIQTQLRHVGDRVGAFRLRRRFYFWGRWLKHASLYPTWVVRLVHKDRIQYRNRGHGETQVVDGEILELYSDLIDENLRGMDDWFARQNTYAAKEATFELEQTAKPGPHASLFSPNPLTRRAALKRVARALPARGLFYFIYSYVLRRGFLDGRDGLVFCVMRSIYQDMIWAKKHDMKRNKARDESRARS